MNDRMVMAVAHLNRLFGAKHVLVDRVDTAQPKAYEDRARGHEQAQT